MHPAMPRRRKKARNDPVFSGEYNMMITDDLDSAHGVEATMGMSAGNEPGFAAHSRKSGDGGSVEHASPAFVSLPVTHEKLTELFVTEETKARIPGCSVL